MQIQFNTDKTIEGHERIQNHFSAEIEEKLKARLKIPIMHDDQHGTAIISSG